MVPTAKSGTPSPLRSPSAIDQGLLPSTGISASRGKIRAARWLQPRRVPSVLVGGVRRILHDANVHRLVHRDSNRLCGVVIDQARRTFEEDVVPALVDIEFAKRLQRVVPAALHRHGKFITPAPRQPYSLLGRPEVAVLADEKRVQPLRGAV